MDTVGLVLEDCSQLSKDMLWKWVSNHRLFNIGRSTCLGLNISRPEQPLSMLECDSTQYSLRWDCDGKVLVGMSEYKLAVESSKRIVAKKKSSYQWKQYMSYDEDLCEHPFQGKKPKICHRNVDRKSGFQNSFEARSGAYDPF